MRLSPFFASVFIFATSATSALALANPPLTPPKKLDVLSGGALGLVCLGLKWLFTAAIIISIIMALLAAYEYMTSAGDPAKTKTATNRLVFAAVGVAVAVLARSLPVLIGSLAGATSTSTDTSSICPSR